MAKILDRCDAPGCNGVRWPAPPGCFDCRERSKLAAAPIDTDRGDARLYDPFSDAWFDDAQHLVEWYWDEGRESTTVPARVWSSARTGPRLDAAAIVRDLAERAAVDGPEDGADWEPGAEAIADLQRRLDDWLASADAPWWYEPNGKAVEIPAELIASYYGDGDSGGGS